MDERLMLQWIEEILTPWANDAPDGIVPFVLLDSYRCHMTDAVKHAMDDIGVEYVHIPGGCTGLCQPVDVGINKPLKDRMVRKWEQFLMENREEEVRGKIPSPSREELGQWIIDSLNSMDEQLIKNAWDGPGFSYFNNNEEEAEEGDADEADKAADYDNPFHNIMIFEA
jgi:DDE superfamily endonuclease.